MTKHALVHEFRERLLVERTEHGYLRERTSPSTVEVGTRRSPHGPLPPCEGETGRGAQRDSNDAREADAAPETAQAPSAACVTADSSARAFGALIIAALLLAVFNSAGLIGYARDLVSSASGRQIYTLSERWHGLMQAAQATLALEALRKQTETARAARWIDLARGLDPEWGSQTKTPRR